MCFLPRFNHLTLLYNIKYLNLKKNFFFILYCYNGCKNKKCKNDNFCLPYLTVASEYAINVSTESFLLRFI